MRKPLQKNHTKKPTVGFLVFGVSGKIFIVKVEKHTDRVEGEQVARQANCNRESTRILGSATVPVALFGVSPNTLLFVSFPAGAGRGTHPAATERSEQHKSGPPRGLVALPMNRISKYSRLFESIRGSRFPFVEAHKQLTQVVDFHDSFR
jgi:hypothetical protein